MAQSEAELQRHPDCRCGLQRHRYRDLVIVDSGIKVEFVSSDSDVVITASMKKQRTN
jgi:hypothetical protein